MTEDGKKHKGKRSNQVSPSKALGTEAPALHATETEQDEDYDGKLPELQLKVAQKQFDDIMALEEHEGDASKNTRESQKVPAARTGDVSMISKFESVGDGPDKTLQQMNNMLEKRTLSAISGLQDRQSCNPSDLRLEEDFEESQTPGRGQLIEGESTPAALATKPPSGLVDSKPRIHSADVNTGAKYPPDDAAEELPDPNPSKSKKRRERAKKKKMLEA